MPWTPSGRHGSRSRRGRCCAAAKGPYRCPAHGRAGPIRGRSIVASEPLERRRYRGYDCSSSTVVDPLAANQSRRHAKVNIATSAPQRSPSLLYRGSNREPTKPPAKALADNPKTHTAIGPVMTPLSTPLSLLLRPMLIGLRLASLDQRNHIRAREPAQLHLIVRL